MNAQIISVGAYKTVKCHRCGARLEVRKLQLIITSENRDEVVKIRTIMQAKIQQNGMDNDRYLSMPADSRKTRSKDPATIIIQNIPVKEEISIEELYEKCAVLGIDKAVVDKVITSLLELGELYSPSHGKIKKV
jgi:DNA replicative helicase MCM subunit Mcm2 (Cdc46/Mcm family)